MEETEDLEYNVYKEYEILSKIGRGAYGIVYHAQHKKTKKFVAIKKIIHAFQNLIDAKRTYRELNYLLQVEHPAIVRLQYLIPYKKLSQEKPSTTRLEVRPADIRGFNTDKVTDPLDNSQKHVYAVFEYLQTDLRMALKRLKQNELQPIQRKYIGYQILQGIAYLHRSGLVHRDIKPQNILLNCQKLEVKICDFGMARLKTSHQSNEAARHTEYVASRWYRPPQALLGASTCHPSIDLWSVGCILAQLALKTPLFQGKSTLDQLQVIFRSIGMPTAKQIDKIQSSQAKYVLKTFTFNRKTKMKPLQQSLAMCSNSEIDLIIGLLSFEPGQRLSAEQALQHQYFNDQVRRINPQLDLFATSKAHIKDLSENNNAQKGKKTKIDIEYYKALVQQLQKFADRSTNRSFPIYQSGFLQAYSPGSCREGSKQVENKEKSTKQSNFVTEHKHQFLSKTHHFLQKVREENKFSEKDEVQSGVNDEAKVKMKKEMRSASKEWQGKNKKSGSHERLKDSKLWKDVREARKEKENCKKISKKVKTSGSISIPKRHSSKGLVGKKIGQGSMHSLHSKIIDNSLVPFINSRCSPNKSKSKQKHNYNQENHASKVQQVLKRMRKEPLKIGKFGSAKLKPGVKCKSGLVKCKSENHGNFFKK